MEKKQINNLEKYVLYLVLTYLCSMILFNFYINYYKHSSTYKWQEYSSYTNNIGVNQQGYVTVELLEGKKYPDLEILVNGDRAKVFNYEDAISIPVKNRDLIQANNILYEEEIIMQITIVDNNNNFIKTRQLKMINNRETLCLIQF